MFNPILERFDVFGFWNDVVEKAAELEGRGKWESQLTKHSVMWLKIINTKILVMQYEEIGVWRGIKYTAQIYPLTTHSSPPEVERELRLLLQSFPNCLPL